MPRSGVRPESEALLAQLRRLWWAGERNQHALAAACGVTRARAQMLLRRWGVGEEPEPVVIRREPAPGEGCAAKGCCEWPKSDSRPWFFCLNPKVPGRVYCREHTLLATSGRHLS